MRSSFLPVLLPILSIACGGKILGDTDGGSSLGSTPTDPCIINASDFTQTCASDVDCVAVPAGNVCGCRCPDDTINKSAQDAYNARLAAAGSGAVGTCPCPMETIPTCCDGVCAMFCH